MSMDQTSEPIACSLSSREAQARAREWARLLERAQAVRSPVAGGMRIELRRLDGAAAELDRLVAAERACCPFLTLRVEAADEVLALTITAPADAEPLIADLFRYARASDSAGISRVTRQAG
jgi:MerR family transcriptional regulator, copper efflux regulator